MRQSESSTARECGTTGIGIAHPALSRNQIDPKPSLFDRGLDSWIGRQVASVRLALLYGPRFVLVALVGWLKLDRLTVSDTNRHGPCIDEGRLLDARTGVPDSWRGPQTSWERRGSPGCACDSGAKRRGEEASLRTIDGPPGLAPTLLLLPSIIKAVAARRCADQSPFMIAGDSAIALPDLFESAGEGITSLVFVGIWRDVPHEKRSPKGTRATQQEPTPSDRQLPHLHAPRIIA